jgi:putative transcriptional regulator
MSKATGKRVTGKRPRLSSVDRGIIQGLKDAIAFERGDRTVGREGPLTARFATAAPAPDFNADRVIDLRKKLGVSQPVFARVLNVSNDTVKGWEQGRYAPSGAAARLLEICEEHPDFVLVKLRAG